MLLTWYFMCTRCTCAHMSKNMKFPIKTCGWQGCPKALIMPDDTRRTTPHRLPKNQKQSKIAPWWNSCVWLCCCFLTFTKLFVYLILTELGAYFNLDRFFAYFTLTKMSVYCTLTEFFFWFWTSIYTISIHYIWKIYSFTGSFSWFMPVTGAHFLLCFARFRDFIALCISMLCTSSSSSWRIVCLLLLGRIVWLL